MTRYPFAPHYAEINTLRLHYVDERQGRQGDDACAAQRTVVERSVSKSNPGARQRGLSCDRTRHDRLRQERQGNRFDLVHARGACRCGSWPAKFLDYCDRTQQVVRSRLATRGPGLFERPQRRRLRSRNATSSASPGAFRSARAMRLSRSRSTSEATSKSCPRIFMRVAS